MFWSKKKPEVVHIIHEISPMDDLDDGSLLDNCEELFNHYAWKYFREKIRRDRANLMNDLAYAEGNDQLERIKGRIKSLDWILLLGKNDAKI
jgi:hypothetical protein